MTLEIVPTKTSRSPLWRSLRRGSWSVWLWEQGLALTVPDGPGQGRDPTQAHNRFVTGVNGESFAMTPISRSNRSRRARMPPTES